MEPETKKVDNTYVRPLIDSQKPNTHGDNVGDQPSSILLKGSYSSADDPLRDESTRVLQSETKSEKWSFTAADTKEDIFAEDGEEEYLIQSTTVGELDNVPSAAETTQFLQLDHLETVPQLAEAEQQQQTANPAVEDRAQRRRSGSVVRPGGARKPLSQSAIRAADVVTVDILDRAIREDANQLSPSSPSSVCQLAAIIVSRVLDSARSRVLREDRLPPAATWTEKARREAILLVEDVLSSAMIYVIRGDGVLTVDDTAWQTSTAADDQYPREYETQSPTFDYLPFELLSSAEQLDQDEEHANKEEVIQEKDRRVSTGGRSGRQSIMAQVSIIMGPPPPPTVSPVQEEPAEEEEQPPEQKSDDWLFQSTRHLSVIDHKPIARELWSSDSYRWSSLAGHGSEGRQTPYDVDSQRTSPWPQEDRSHNDNDHDGGHATHDVDPQEPEALPDRLTWQQLFTQRQSRADNKPANNIDMFRPSFYK